MSTIGRHLLVAVVMGCAGAVSAETPCGTWEPVSLPDAAGKRLVSVSASSATDVWSVGKGAYHWNGAAWSSVTVPGLVNSDPQGYADTTLSSVFAAAPDLAWIVGNSSFLGTPQTFVERWDGSAWH